MKAVVLDVTDGEATLMTGDGDIIGIADKGYDIGQEITIEDNKRSTLPFTAKIYRFMPAIAAAAAILITLGTGSYAYYKPYGTVSLDINPSIEYTINRFDRVLRVNGVNDDGSDILSEIDVSNLINKSIESALDATIEQIEADGYISDEDGNYVVVTANTGKESHTDKLVDKLDRTVAGHENMTPIAVKVSDDELNEAHRQGISAGKKMMVDRLDKVTDEEIDRKEWNGRSIREIADEYDRIQKTGRDKHKSVPDEPESVPDETSQMQEKNEEKQDKPDVKQDKPDGNQEKPDNNNSSIDQNNRNELPNRDNMNRPADDRGSDERSAKPEDKGNPECSEGSVVIDNPVSPDEDGNRERTEDSNSPDNKAGRNVIDNHAPQDNPGAGVNIEGPAPIEERNIEEKNDPGMMDNNPPQGNNDFQGDHMHFESTGR